MIVSSVSKRRRLFSSASARFLFRTEIPPSVRIASNEPGIFKLSLMKRFRPFDDHPLRLQEPISEPLHQQIETPSFVSSTFPFYPVRGRRKISPNESTTIEPLFS